MARRNVSRSIVPSEPRVVSPRRRAVEIGDSGDTGSSETIRGICGGRSSISTVFTAIRYDPVEKAESHENELTLRNTCKSSCVRSSAWRSFVRQRAHRIHALLVTLEESGKGLVRHLCARAEQAALIRSLGSSVEVATTCCGITQVATVVLLEKLLFVASMIREHFHSK